MSIASRESHHPAGRAIAARAGLAWAVIAGAMLAGSGVLRTIQAARHQEEKDYKVQCPFPLQDLPKAIGPWRYVDGSETKLDDLTTRITGSTDHVLWKFKDDQTGTILSALVLYGPAEPVVPHTPQVCYPATGYQPVGGFVDRPIKFEQGTVPFRSSVFTKSGGRDVIRTVVYHSFRLDGTWSPGIGDRKFPRKSPGIFKVQIQRRALDGEGGENSAEPIEQFLQAFLPVLERKVAASQPSVAMANLGGRS